MTTETTYEVGGEHVSVSEAREIRHRLDPRHPNVPRALSRLHSFVRNEVWRGGPHGSLAEALVDPKRGCGLTVASLRWAVGQRVIGLEADSESVAIWLEFGDELTDVIAPITGEAARINEARGHARALADGLTSDQLHRLAAELILRAAVREGEDEGDEQCECNAYECGSGNGCAGGCPCHEEPSMTEHCIEQASEDAYVDHLYDVMQQRIEHALNAVTARLGTAVVRRDADRTAEEIADELRDMLAVEARDGHQITVDVTATAERTEYGISLRVVVDEEPFTVAVLSAG